VQEAGAVFSVEIAPSRESAELVLSIKSAVKQMG
jgi:hypothetical protein